MERLTPGQPLRAVPSATWNQFTDTSKAIAQSAPKPNTQGSRGAQALKVLVHNGTGSDMTADFPIVKLGGPVHSPAARAGVVYEGLQLEATAPDADTKAASIAIVQSPIADGQFRPAVTRGPSYCDLLWTDAAHTCAAPAATNTHLTSSAVGIRVLWHDTLPDSLPAVVKALVWLDPQGGRGFIRGASVGASPPDQGWIQVTDPTPLGENSVAPSGDVFIWKGARTLGTVEYTTADLSWWNVEPGEYVFAAYLPGVHTSGVLEGSTEEITFDWIWLPNDRGYFIANCSALTAGPITNPGITSGSGELWYCPHGSASDGSDSYKVSLGSVGIANPFPYAFDGGWHIVEYIGDWVGAPGVFGLTGTDLTGLPSFSTETQQLLWHDESGGPQWGDLDDLASTIIEVGGGGGGGDTVAEGYAIDVAGSGTVTVSLDPTEITGFATTANTMQFFQHLPADTSPTGPAWKTITNYNSGADQFWWKRSAAFQFVTLTGYNSGPAAGTPQLIVNTDGNSGWKFIDTSGYDPGAGKTQLLGQIAGVWQWKSIKDWLNSHLAIELVLDTSGHHLTVNLKCDGTTISTSSVDTSDCGDS